MNEGVKNLLKRFLPSFAITYGRSLSHSLRQTISLHQSRWLLEGKKEVFLEIGASTKRAGNEWITLGFSRNCDIFWDLKRGLPFPDKSMHKIYSSHVFEHFTYKQGQELFGECHRVLVSGGIFSICVPNARLYFEAYLNDSDLSEENCLGHRPGYNNTSKIDYVNYVAYMDGEHKYMFDEDNIVVILRNVGFRNVRIRAFDPDIDLEQRRFQSIYAEAVK